MANTAQLDLDDAIQTAKQAPHAVSGWEDLEGVAADRDKPDAVVDAYRTALSTSLASEVAEMIGQRAIAFCDEWFGDDPKVLEGILRRVLELAPQSEAALERLGVILTDGERWGELLAAYDRALEGSKDKTRRIRLLREASQLAKDVANQPEKAIVYMQRLLPLAPDDLQLSTGLERLLERHERWADLIALWEGRLDALGRKERERSRMRIASVWLEQLREPARALASARPLLAEAEDDAEATALIERIIGSRDGTRQVRDAALEALRGHYDASGRPREIIRVLEQVIAIDPSGSRALREEAGARLAELDDDKAAMDHYAALLALQPESSVTQEKLRQLAQRSDNWGAYVEGVATAGRSATAVARRVELLAEAARTRLDLLSDADGAVDLYQEALAQEGAGEREQLMVSRRLSELYTQVDRPRERLDVLERLADLEQGDSARLGVLGAAARLAESLGDSERALILWQRRVDIDANDLTALDARVALLEGVRRWTDLIDALETRAKAATSPAQKRTDRIKIAGVYQEKCNDLPRAIAAWQAVAKESGEDAESVSALSDLFSATGQWREMADLLERSSGRDTQRTLTRLGRLGDAQRLYLGEPQRAVDAYRSALAIDPSNQVARDGLRALLESPPTRKAAIAALADAFSRCREWNAVLELMPARLADAEDDRTRLALLRESAGLRSEQGDNEGALADLCAAFPLAPRDSMIEDKLRTLAERTNEWTGAGAAYAGAIAALATVPEEAARLCISYAGIQRKHLGDERAALESYLAAAASVPGEPRAVKPGLELAAAAGRWDDAAQVAVGYFMSREGADEEILAQLSDAAIAAGGDAVDRWTSALARADEAATMAAPARAAIAARLAALHRDHRRDTQSALTHLRRALELGGDRASWLRELASLERTAAANRQLLSTLQRLAELDGRDLDSLVEAADLASKLGDREQALVMLDRVLGRAGTAWRGNAQVTSSRPAEAVARWAIDGLVDLHRMAGQPRPAIDVLSEAARLPFDDAGKRSLRLRAAEIAARDLDDRDLAIDMYRVVLATNPGDREVMEPLGTLLAAADRVPELLALRQEQLRCETDPERKLPLRLEIAELVSRVEQRGGRYEALRANLDEQPGHDASVAAISRLLSDKGQHRELCDLLEDQASRLEAAADAGRAAKLFARCAEIAETDLEDVERAIACHRRVAGIVPSGDSLSALARLNLERGQPAQAVPWLETLVSTAAGEQRLKRLEELAQALLAARQPDRAIAAIELNLDSQQPALQVRDLLADLYRQSEQWEPLARHLTRSLAVVGEKAGDYAREAAEIYAQRLGQPGKAVPALETALALDPQNKDLRGQLAEGLRVAGRIPEARALLGELIGEFGRRRSPERAALHVRLARVAQAEGNLEEALTEMEQASKMDVSNALIQRELAEMARTGGQVDKAERTYRALLVAVRRQPPGDDETAVGVAEVLYELYKIVNGRGDADQSRELLDSAVDAATQTDAEVARLRRSLVAHGDQALLLKVIDLRLAQSPSASSQAKLLTDKADALAAQGEQANALDAILAALQAVPGRLESHDRARSLAKATGQTRRYVEAVDAVVDRLRRKDDPPLVADILMRAGLALEEDAGDPKGAASMYQRVELIGQRLAECYYAQARVAAQLGDTDEQARSLDKMLALAGSGDPANQAQIDALYRLSEIFMATAKRRKQGVDLLERAFAAEPRWTQAGRILRAAAQDGSDDPRVLALFERVARNGGDPELLFDYLDMRTRAPNASQEQIREAVKTATDSGQSARTEPLLHRAIELARASAEGFGAAAWAALALAERQLASGDLAQAKELVFEVSAYGEQAEVDSLAARIAARAAGSQQRAERELAAEVFEFLRERHPTDRAVWQPLLALYRELGDGDRLSSVVSSTLPGLEQASERNALRIEHARFLIGRLQRHHDAMDVLRDALSDDPDDLAVAELLERSLREIGDDEGMTEFLWNRFEDAQRRGNRASTVDVAMRLGALLDGTGATDDAGRVYRAAMTVAPDDRDILRQVVAHVGSNEDPRDVAQLMERLLAVETADRVPGLCQKLASAWESAGDAAGVQRTLELAHGAAPDDGAIHDRLESWYRDHGQWSELCELMCRDAERATDPHVAVGRLREAAGVFSQSLGQPLRAAAVLRQALGRRPQDAALVSELALALAAGDEVGEAVTAIGNALEQIQGSDRVELLLLRAQLHQRAGDDPAAVGDLREAYGLAPAIAMSAYSDGLERMRTRSQAQGDEAAERAATLRHAELLAAHGDLESARAMLVGWIERDSGDAEPLYMLCDMDASIEHWPGVVAGATRLAYITSGEDQVAAALRAADAATRAGNPAEAVPVLEVVYGQQPAVSAVRDRLRAAYEAGGQSRELAGILFADAEHGDDLEVRFATYRRAAELYLYQAGDAEAAAPATARALELKPEDHAAMMMHIDVLLGLNQVEQASRTLEESINAQKRRTPELAVLQQRMARVAQLQGNRDEQVNWLKKAFDVDRKNAEVAAELAQVATEMGDYELALKPLRAITLMENPAPVTRPMALLWEAKIENARGNRAKAELWAKKALREDPTFSEAQSFLDELAG